MEFTADKAAATLVFNGQTYYFCHAACLRVFQADPLKYLMIAPDSPAESILTMPER